MPPAVLTVGHSNHPRERFLARLARHGVGALVDIGRFPASRKHPHFHRDNSRPGTTGRRHGSDQAGAAASVRTAHGHH